MFIHHISGQIEKVHLDGSKTIFYPDGQQRVIRAEGGGEEVILKDGTVYSASPDCERTVYPNGDVEWKMEEYTVGTHTFICLLLSLQRFDACPPFKSC